MEALTSIEKRKGFVKVEDFRYYTEFNSSPETNQTRGLTQRHRYKY